MLNSFSDAPGNPAPTADDEAYQTRVLQFVSRTFALTTPKLPDTLRRVVSNAYLLCRIADTIEDDSALNHEQTSELTDLFIRVVAGTASAQIFADRLHPLLSTHTLAEEHDLVRHTPAVIRITHSFNPNQRAALEQCIRIMARGMAHYQSIETKQGLTDMAAMNHYCYYVAGVVGEMLTQLFCDYHEAIDAHKNELMRLAVSFGQGLQMTNILKDIWDDYARGACWLPREVFQDAGFNLDTLSASCHDERFQRGLQHLIAIAGGHLRDALTYTLLIPARETGIRQFCLLALGMAVLTLDKINRHLDFSDGSEVKISRRSVKATLVAGTLFARHDRVLKMLFDYTSRNLPAIAGQ